VAINISLLYEGNNSKSKFSNVTRSQN